MTPLGGSQVENARSELARAAIALERALIPGSEQGEAWKTYLHWKGVQQQLAPEKQLDLRALRSTLHQLRKGHPGLERPEFQAVILPAQRLFDLGLVSQVKDQAAYFKRQAAELGNYLDRDPAVVDPRASWQIERRLARWASVSPQARVVTAANRQLCRPNLHFVAQQRVLKLLARRPVSDTRPLRDNILGTRLTGTGRTAGQVTLSLLPSASSARLVFSLDGSIASQTRGVNGPVLIRSTGDTSFHGAKVVELTNERFHILPANIDAKTSTRTRSITKLGGRFGKRLVESIAHKKVAEARGQANAIASRKAESQVADEFNRQVLDEVRFARKRYDNLVRKPLRRRGAEPQEVTFSTTSGSLHTTALVASPQQLGAAGLPPSAPSGDLSVRLHQSAINNLANAFLAGATISRQSADQPTSIDVVLPPRLKKAIENQREKRSPEPAAETSKFRPWSIKLRDDRPVSFVFSEGQITALVHTTAITSGQESFRGWDLIVTYRPVREGGKWYAELVGKIEVLPTSFDPGRPGARIPSRQRALRRNLSKQLSARALEDPNFPRRPELKPIDLANLRKPGLNWLSINNLVADNGWLSLSFDAR